MSPPPGHGRRAGLELLERSLAFTRGALVEVTDHDLARPTPCAEWHLAVLLAHMEDALDAFDESAAGRVGLQMTVPARVRVETLQHKACALLGAWTSATTEVVLVGGLPLDVDVVTHTAALEITVHGWDVAQSLDGGQRLGRRIPADLAARLLPAAGGLIDEADRGVRFGRALAVTPGAPPDVRLLAATGRHLGWARRAA